jgi:hypothetical protein
LQHLVIHGSVDGVILQVKNLVSLEPQQQLSKFLVQRAAPRTDACPETA